MRRDDLYITVPSSFRCPISLEVMKSPVSLCTGVTYDRSSIQRWLDGGNNTCPATMQLLPSKDLVPNLTLHRLIHLWSQSLPHQPQSNSPNSPLKSDRIESFIQSLKSIKPNECGRTVEYLSKLLSFAEESEESREFLSKSEGFVQLIIDLLNGNDIEEKRLVVEVLALLLDTLRDQQDLLSALLLKSDRDYLSPLSLILKHGRVRSRIAVARTVEFVAIDAESKLLIASNERFLIELVNNLIHDSDSESILSCLISLAIPKRVKVSLVVHHKIITRLKQTLLDKNVTVMAIESALKLLEAVSCCGEGREEMCREEGVVEAVVGKVLKVSAAATEHAVTVLWSVCYLFRDRRAVAAVARSNGLAKVLLILQSGCSPPVRQMAADLLKVLRVDSKMAGVAYSYDTKTTHIMPF